MREPEFAKYSLEKRIRAVSAYLESPEGTTIAQIADSMDIHRESLRTWVRNAQKGAKPPYTRKELQDHLDACEAKESAQGQLPIDQPDADVNPEPAPVEEDHEPPAAEAPDDEQTDLERSTSALLAAVQTGLPSHVEMLTVGEIVRLATVIGRHETEVDSWRKRAQAAAADARKARAEIKQVRREYEQRIAKLKARFTKIQNDIEGL